MNKIYRTSPVMLLSDSPKFNNKTIHGQIGVNFLFYSKETAEDFIKECGYGTIDEVYETNLKKDDKI